MLKSFRTYQLALEFHHAVRAEYFPSYLKDQLLISVSELFSGLRFLPIIIFRRPIFHSNASETQKMPLSTE